MSTTPPGWYDDGHGAMRWWDGETWTDHTHVPEAAPAAETASGEGATPETPVYATAHAQPEMGAAPPYGQGPYGQQSAVPQHREQGYDPAYGAAPQAAPKKKRAWLIPVIIGGALVLLGGIALAIFLTIQAFEAGRSAAEEFSGGSASASAPPSAEPSAESSADPSAEASTAPSAEVTGPPPGATGEELPLDHPATDTVRAYDEAYQSADCDGLTATTSEYFRADMTCDDLTATAEEFNAGVTDYVVTVDRVSRSEDGSVVVETTETYSSILPDDIGTEYYDLYVYTLLEEDGTWVIDLIDTAE